MCETETALSHPFITSVESSKVYFNSYWLSPTKNLSSIKSPPLGRFVLHLLEMV